MMLQFEVFTISGVRYLTVVDTTRWRFFIGFRRIIERFP